MKQLRVDLELAKKDLEKVEEEKKYVDVIREILSDRGARANIIKKYLPIMNQLINKYLQDMDFFISFILDEIFDSSLDGQGTEDFFKIVRTMPKENIFIISHKGDILFDKFTNIVKFQKEHNFTQLEAV